MTPEEAEIAIAKTQAQQQAAEAAAKEPLAVPLPGPTRDALALDESIQAGKWRVRAFQDGDWEVLAALGHPLERNMQEQLLAMFTGKPKPDESVFIPRGPLMWQLAYVMTRPGIEVDKLVQDKGPQAVKDAAKAEFSRETSHTLANDIYPAIMKQVELNWNPGQG